MSGAAALRGLPDDWQVKPLKATVEGCINGTWGGDPDGANDLACIRVADFDRVAGRVRADRLTIRSIPARERGIRLLRRGDLLLEKSGGGELQPVGKVVLFDLDISAVCSNFVARMPVARGNDPRFLCYLHDALYALRVNTKSIKQNTGIQNLDSAAYLSEKVRVPSQRTQVDVADFLDRETAKIDALIAKKEQLSGLLLEAHRALSETLLQRAQGATKALKRHIDLLPGYAFSSEDFVSESPESVRLLRGVNIGTDGIRWDQTVWWPRAELQAFSRYRLSEGDIVFGMDRPWISDGVRVALVKSDDLPALLLQRVARIRARAGLLQGYLELLLRSQQFKAFFEADLTGVSVPHISAEQIGSFRFIVPSITEQSCIVASVQESADLTARKREQLSRSTDRLREYRSALITAAVTGQIDVTKRLGSTPAASTDLCA